MRGGNGHPAARSDGWGVWRSRSDNVLYEIQLVWREGVLWVSACVLDSHMGGRFLVLCFFGGASPYPLFKSVAGAGNSAFNFEPIRTRRPAKPKELACSAAFAFHCSCPVTPPVVKKITLSFERNC